uniref:NADPH-dependent 7-cyano-7-deazaguanine reductase n=1 Tax=Candidatus Kentrum sp. SD TaxID=2126332 RepID=A0A450Z0Z1_9GAMM|nr:MAG: 7-cyano-7-deazaguanine reductase [Candidatus Kentron sp. SD]VFK47473.1 MAG: 7-cyano-7-deazaguanine reductase [Candidatus Kentron sp. SD]
MTMKSAGSPSADPSIVGPPATDRMNSQALALLETFENPYPEREYTISIRVPEFTCVCPKTGQPDFATLHIEYIPGRFCVELKSLKNYVWSYRAKGAFHEAVTNHILEDLVSITKPRFLRITAEFNVRGGIYTTVTAEHRSEGWVPADSRRIG